MAEFFKISLLVLALLVPTTIGANSKLFREYIGAELNNVRFSDLLIDPTAQFHFILAFAIDYTPSGSSPTNGKFNIFSNNDNLTPSIVQAIKSKHKNVKVALSLGGDSVGSGNIQFRPSSVSSWNNVISFTSVDPYDDGPVQSHYSALWKSYGESIDYVNFQFYAYDSSTTVSQFIKYFNAQESRYSGRKVLASFVTEGSGGLSPANGFFDACRMLRDSGKLNGIFVWCADSSQSNDFQYEKQSQAVLLGS